MQADYPGWGITKDLRAIFEEIAESWARRLHAEAA
jgi:hypothetical protein